MKAPDPLALVIIDSPILLDVPYEISIKLGNPLSKQTHNTYQHVYKYINK